MILILLAFIVPATADPDYIAVEIESGDEYYYKMFTKISKCGAAVYYQSGDNRVLFQDEEAWKIGTLTNELDCNTVSSVIEEEYRNEEIQRMPKDDDWIYMKKTDNSDDDIDSGESGDDIERSIKIKGFNKSVEVTVTGLKLEDGTKVEAKSKEDCLKKDWGDFSPDKDIVVAFQDFSCFYNFVDEAELKVETWRSTIFVHPAGKNELRMI